MKQIRILLAGMPTMLMDIISEVVAADPDIIIVDKTTESNDVRLAARRSRADVVIVQQASSLDDAEQAEVLSVQRPFKLIVIAEGGRRGFLYELRPHCIPLGEMSASGLVAAIRTAADGEPS